MKKVIVVFIFFTKFLFANASVIDIEEPQYLIGKKTFYYEDINSILIFEDIRKVKEFEPVLNNIHSHIFTSSTLWYQFEVHNPTKKSLERYIVFDIPWLDSISIYIVDKNNRITTYSIGDTLEFKNRSFLSPILNIKHTFNLENSLVYIQVKTRDPFIVPISILDETSFLEMILNQSSFINFIYGCIISILIFNLFLWFIIKERVYLVYVLYLISFLIMHWSYSGYFYEYIPKSIIQYDIQNWIHSITIQIFGILGLFFARVYLELDKKYKKLNKVTLTILKLIIVGSIISALLGYHYHVAFSILILVPSSLYIIVIGIYTYKKGNLNAKFFILGTTAGFLGTLFTALTSSALIPYNEYFFKAVEVGMTLDAVLLSIALANRYKNLYSNLQMKQKELDYMNNNLLVEVEQRTNDLSKELRNKNILLKEIFHRVKNNLQIISSLLSLQVNKVQLPKDQQIFKDNIKRIKTLSLLHEMLFTSNNLEVVNLKKYISSIIETLDSLLEENSIYVKLECENLQLQSIHAVPLGLVINELITNSLKYAFDKTIKDKQILINIQYKKDLLIEFYDNGKGADLDSTKEGFGFKLVQTLIVYQLKGEIECVNQDGLYYKIKLKEECLK